MIKAKEINNLAQKALESGNPYIDQAIEYFIGHIPNYIFAERSYTEEKLNEEYLKTARHDIGMGYKDRMAGYYDKWYRYSHADEGRAYDLGVKLALNDPKCPEEFNIIECN